MANISLHVSDIARFWSHVNKDGPIMREGLTPCWEWTINRTRGGYGQFSISKLKMEAHRVAFLIEHGRLPVPPLMVLHECDNPPCVRHLYEGSPQDNMDDRVLRGRQSVGEMYSNHRLTDDKVREIRHMWAHDTVSKSVIAARMGVSRPTVSRVLRGLIWSHVK